MMLDFGDTLVFTHGLAFTRYCPYQYCMLNGNTGGAGGEPYIAQH